MSLFEDFQQHYSPLTNENTLSHDEYVVSLSKAASYCNSNIDSFIPFLTTANGNVFIVPQKFGEYILIKIPDYSKNQLDFSRQARNKLLKEATYFERLSGSGVPRIFHIDSDGYFLAREYIEGRILAEIDESYVGFETVSSILSLGGRIIRRLSADDSVSIFHGDFKPKNIILNLQRQAFLIDFGSVHKNRENDGKRYEKRNRLGTNKWLFKAPEQLGLFDGKIDNKADIFGICATAFFTLTGKAPFSNIESDKEKAIHIFERRETEIRKELSLSDKKNNLQKTIVEFIINGLSLNPSHRPTKSDLYKIEEMICCDR
jgi:serine/threonine protein kinase